MFTIQNYVLPQTPAEAYELSQRRDAVVLGGCGWLKMQHRRIGTAIDLSSLALNHIEETENEFSIGAMVTLRQIEQNHMLAAHYGSFLADSVRSIVGVQFRNCATVGGSIFARFGFSDVLTALLVLDAQVELAGAGRISLTRFAEAPFARDVLLRICLPKAPVRAAYLSYRNTATDLPIITVAAARFGSETQVAVGARPRRARLCVMHRQSGEALDALSKRMAAEYDYGSNLRGSAEYRQHLAKMLLQRALGQLEEV